MAKAPSITKPHTGAFYALQEWNAARSFPADQAQGFHQAYEHMKRDMQPVRQAANLKVSGPWEPIGNMLLPQDAGNVTMIATSDGAPIAGVGFVFNDQWFEPAIGNATRLK